jgi:hypothetical protein
VKVSVVQFNHLLESWASRTSPIKYFTVENVLFGLGLDESFFNQVLQLLMSRDGFEVKAEKMALCPSNHKLEAFPLDEEMDDYFECFCQEEEFEVTKFILVFSFVDEYLMDVKKKENRLNSSNDLILI